MTEARDYVNLKINPTFSKNMENGRKLSFNGPTNAAGVLTPLRRLLIIRCSGR